MLAIEATSLTRVYPGRREHRGRRGRATSATVPARRALDGVTLRVPQGQFVALLGPNGSGKSTLLRILATLDAPSSGEIVLLGERSPAKARRALGVVFQHEALDPLLTVRENLRVQAALFGLRGADAAQAIEAAAGSLGVADRLDDRVGTLSGGLRRRADLARALLSNPRLLLLDEPTSGLDFAARASFLDTLDALRRERSMTVVLCTHLMDEAERTERVVMLREGSIVADDAPGALRGSLGGAVLRAAHGACARLERFPLTLRDAGREVIASGEPDAVADAARALADEGTPFVFGPPTLGDVYLARTGAALEEGLS